MSPKPLTKFVAKNGKNIEIHLPTLSRIESLLRFVNRLIEEDTFLYLTGKVKTFEEEETWLKNAITEMKAGRSSLFWAIYDGEIVGSVDIHRGTTRDFHVGKIGLMIDKDFRNQGIGKFLLNFILEQARKMEITIATLEIFDDNEIAKKIYQKFGFKEFSCLPKGFYRQGKYSDALRMYKNIA